MNRSTDVFRATSESVAFQRAETAIRQLIAERHDRASLVSDMACRIGAEIIEGIRKPGDDLNSVELARTYESSRTPVREALMLLEKEGLVEILARRRPRVTSYNFEDIRDVYSARSALLELAASTIASTASKDQIDRLHEDLAAMAANLDDVSSYMWANVAFHSTQTEISGNRYLKRVVDSLLLRTLPLRRLSLAQPGRIQRSYDDHLRLVQSYVERDTRLAAAIVRNNHMNALAQLRNLLGQSSIKRRP